MLFTERVREAEFIKRYKRFFADIRLPEQSDVIVAHVPNTGSLKTCLFEGAPCIVTENDNPARKLRATLQFVKTPTSWVGVNTALPNGLVFESRAELWTDFAFAQREYKISKESRLDLALARTAEDLSAQQRLHFVEVKNVTYAEGSTALFPDAVTTRGQKHLIDLMRLCGEGHSAEILFVIQREDCNSFAPADSIDPTYGRLLRQARAAGVRVRALQCDFLETRGIVLNLKPLPLAF